MKHARNTLKFIIMAGMALLLLLGAAAVPVAAEEPTVIVSHYIVTPSVLVPDGYGTIQVTLTDTAGTAVLRESSGISAAGEFQTTRSTDIPAEIESIELVGDKIKVIDGNFKRFGAIGPGQSVNVTFSIQAPGTWEEIAAHTQLMVAFGGLALKNSQVNVQGVGIHSAEDRQRACRDAGVQFVNISPVRDDTADFLEAEWVAPRPNTDTAVMLGLRIP